MTTGLVVGSLTTVLGAVVASLLSHLAQRHTERRAEQARLLALMQELVVAAGQLDSARKALDARWLSRKARLRMLAVAGVEFGSAWHSGQATGWTRAGAAYAPMIRVLDSYRQRAADATVELTVPMARVAAAGLALGMAEDTNLAAAAQNLTNAALENKGQDAIEDAVRALRAAFYPKEKPFRRRS
jgi:hypothetical protein